MRQANQDKRLHAIDQGLQVRGKAVVGQAKTVSIVDGQVSMLQCNRLEGTKIMATNKLINWRKKMLAVND